MGQRFTEMGQKRQNMPFLAKMTYLAQKWHILMFLAHICKSLTHLLYTIGISKVFLII